MTFDPFSEVLESIRAAAGRTRAIILVIFVVFGSVFTSGIDGLSFFWAAQRANQITAAVQCLSSPALFRTVKLNGFGCGDLLAYSEKAFGVAMPGLQALIQKQPAADPDIQDFVVQHAEQKKLLEARAAHVFRSYYEKLSVSLPLVGSSIDRNNLFVFSSIMMSLLILALATSLLGERRNIKITDYLDNGLTDTQKELIISSHLFSGTSYVFMAGWLLVFVPVMLSTLAILMDLGWLFSDRTGDLSQKVSDILLGPEFDFWSFGARIFDQVSQWVLGIFWVVSIFCYGAAVMLILQLRGLRPGRRSPAA